METKGRGLTRREEGSVPTASPSLPAHPLRSPPRLASWQSSSHTYRATTPPRHWHREVTVVTRGATAVLTRGTSAMTFRQVPFANKSKQHPRSWFHPFDVYRHFQDKQRRGADVPAPRGQSSYNYTTVSACRRLTTVSLLAVGLTDEGRVTVRSSPMQPVKKTS